MKAGMGLMDLAQELERQANNKKDFIAPSQKLVMSMQEEMPFESALEKVVATVDMPQADDREQALSRLLNTVNVDTASLNGTHKDPVLVPHLIIDEGQAFSIGRVAHEQISARLGIPRRYYDRMLEEAPNLLVDNVNHWLHEDIARRMVRTMDGRARAFLSDRYRPLDSVELLAAVLPSLLKADCKIVSCDLTERRMYIKAVSPKIQAKVSKGDIVQAGIVLSNSEVGCGSVRVEPLTFRLVCLNGAIMADKSMKKYHVGRSFGEASENAYEMYRDETRKQDDKAFFMKVQDVVNGTLDQDLFQMNIKKIEQAASRGVEAPLQDVVENVGQKYSLTEGETGDMLKLLIKGGDLTQWGMANAVTQYSQDTTDYERATELERIGGQVIELSGRDWTALAA